MSNELIVRALGGLTVELNGRSLTAVLSRKAQAMLVYLACQQRPVAREVLTALLWEESAADQGMTNLRKTLFELRQLTPDHLLVERQTIGLSAHSPLWLDTAELARLLSEEKIEAMETAVALYHGRFLADFELPDCPEFMIWVAVQREQAQQLAVRALRALADHCLNQRRYQEGITYAQTLAQLLPFSEGASRALMLLLARSGQPELAVAEYERCRQQLAAELGVEPTTTTQTLLARIETAVAHLPALPLSEQSFVGRQLELAQINQHLADPACRWVTIVGPGGVGKTRLALQIASEWAYDFLHGVHFVSLTAVDSPATLIHSIIAALNLPLSGPEPAQQQLVNYLRQKEMLLLLDGGETVLTPTLMDTADLLPDLLRQAPLTRLLVTSRERFNYQTERVVALSGLPLTDEGAARLFLERAAPGRPDFVPTPEDLSAIQQICQLVEGLPLAIELAASKLTAYAPQQIVTEISQTLDFLQDEAYPDRHNSLRAVFETAWQSLSASEQAIFARLSLFPGGFTAAAAAAIAEAAPPLLLSLVDKSMLYLVNQRYYLHQLLRQFVAEKLSPAEETAIWERYGRYYADFLHQQEEPLGGHEQRQALQLIAAEIDNARLTWQWLIKNGRTADISQVIASLHCFYDIRGWFVEGEAAFRQAASQWRNASPETHDAATRLLLGRLLARQGFFLERLSHLETAVECLQAALSLVRGHDLREEAFILNQLGLAAYEQGRYTQAETHYRQSIAASREAGAADEEATTLVNLGAMLREQGQYQAARDLIEEGLSLLRPRRNQRQLAIALQTLGNVAEAEGAYVEAQVHFRESLAICEQLGDLLGRAILCANLSNMAQQQNALPEARNWGRQALQFFQEVGDPWGIAVSSVRLGELALATADYEEARQLFRASLSICREVGDRRGTAVSLCNLGYTALGLELYPQAGALFREAIDIGMDIQFLPSLLKSLMGMAELLAQTGEPERADTVAAFVRQHPAADDKTRNRADELLLVWTAQRPEINTAQMSLTQIIAMLKARPDKETTVVEQKDYP